MVALAAVAAPAIGHGDDRERVITVQTTPRAVHVQDEEPRTFESAQRIAQGDRVSTTQGLSDADRRPLGTLYTDCTAMGEPAALLKAEQQCLVTFELGGGTIVAAGTLRLGSPDRVPIVGGTGRYAKARGFVVTGPPAPGFESADEIHLAR